MLLLMYLLVKPVFLKLADKRVQTGHVWRGKQIEQLLEAIHKLGSELLASPLGQASLLENLVQALGWMLVIDVKSDT